MSHRSEKFRNGLRDLASEIQGRGDKIGEALEAAGLVFEKVGELARRRNCDVSSILTGDVVADRALLEAAGVQGEITARGWDWSSALKLAEALLKAAIATADIMA